MWARLKFVLAVVLSLFVLNLSAAAWADDSSTSGAGTSSGTGSNTLAKTSSSGTAKSFVENLPGRLASFAVATAVGTPIALTRCTHRELIKQTKEAYTLGGMPKPMGWVTAALFGVPSGVLCGVWYGLSDGVADSWVGSEQPFSKDSFSLDKLEW